MSNSENNDGFHEAALLPEHSATARRALQTRAAMAQYLASRAFFRRRSPHAARCEKMGASTRALIIMRHADDATLDATRISLAAPGHEATRASLR